MNASIKQVKHKLNAVSSETAAETAHIDLHPFSHTHDNIGGEKKNKEEEKE